MLFIDVQCICVWKGARKVGRMRFLVKSERPHIFFASMPKESLAFLKYLDLPMNAPVFSNYARFIFIFLSNSKLIVSAILNHGISYVAARK